MNKIFTQSNNHTQQKQGIIVCLPKSNGAQNPEVYQPFTLLNTDYKILAGILAHRLPPVLWAHSGSVSSAASRETESSKQSQLYERQ
jgi:hypothetical protein